MRLNTSILPDYTSALVSFKAGEGQVLMNLDAKDVASMQQQAGFNVQVGPTGKTDVFFFDSANPESPFSDIKVRQAFWHAINKQALADLGPDVYINVNQPYPPYFWPHNPDVVGYEYNIDEAKRLLEEAGYSEGFTFDLNMVAGRPKEIPLLIQSDLSKVGITMNIQEWTMAKYGEMVVFGGWNGIAMASGAGWVPKHPSLGERQSCISLTEGMGWISSQRFPELTELFLEANAERDFSTAEGMYHDLYKMMVDDYCAFFFGNFVPTLTVLYG
jgi:peptide/nickel transport system substrate-binding protein